jgi:hypothetical protein
MPRAPQKQLFPCIKLFFLQHFVKNVDNYLKMSEISC